MQRSIKVAAAASALLLGLSACSSQTTPTPDPSQSQTPSVPAVTKVPPALFGLVVQSLPKYKPQPGTKSVRIWDDGVTWRKIEPSKGSFDWSKFDEAVANAQSVGAVDVNYVLGSTPEWAAARVGGAEIYGPGSASHPKQLADFLNYVKAVVTRYKGKITSYQVWNEANLRDFYSGNPGQLAALTAATYKTIKAIDPQAIVAAAGLVPRPGRFDPGSFGERYLLGLKAAGWPLDAFVFSLYPEEPDTNLRRVYLDIGKAALAKAGAPKKPLWESELNYVTPNNENFSDEEQMRLVAVSYIESLPLGLARSYWYSQNTQLPNLGVKMTTKGDKEPTAAAAAFKSISSWMSGKPWGGCTTAAGTTTCKLGDRQQIVYRSSGSASIPAQDVAAVCELDGSCETIPPNKGTIKVGMNPILLGTK